MTGLRHHDRRAECHGRPRRGCRETLADRFPVPVKRLGLKDCFGESGPNETLLDKYRLSAARVAEDVEGLLRGGDRAEAPMDAPKA